MYFLIRSFLLISPLDDQWSGDTEIIQLSQHKLSTATFFSDQFILILTVSFFHHVLASFLSLLS